MERPQLAHNLDQTQRTNDVHIDVNVNFESMFLPRPLLRGLTEAGFRRPSPIQLKAIPLARCGIDLIVQAKSGTGKTLVFAIAALDSLTSDVKRAQIIILAPTREIAYQIEDVVNSIGSYIEGLKTGLFIGGVPLNNDRQNVQGCQIIVGAPGRVRHLIELGVLRTSAVRMLVLDEADMLADQSFREDINYIFNDTPEGKQMIACSATYTEELREFLFSFMKSGRHVTPEGDFEAALFGLKQFVYLLDDHVHQIKRFSYKVRALTSILRSVEFDQCFVFVNFVTMAESLSKTLVSDGFKAGFLSAGQSQERRLKSMAEFKSYTTRILVATELAARGIDAPSVNLVINFECPVSVASYLHRMGRAGRYGSYGLCVTLINENFEETKFKGLLTSLGGPHESVGLIKNESTLSCLWTHDFDDPGDRLWAAPLNKTEEEAPKGRPSDSRNSEEKHQGVDIPIENPWSSSDEGKITTSEDSSGGFSVSGDRGVSPESQISDFALNPEGWLDRIHFQIESYVKYANSVNTFITRKYFN